MNIHLRGATPDDAAVLAAIEVTSWQAAYRGIMPDPFLDGLSQEEKRVSWHQNLLKHGPRGQKRVLLALHRSQVIGFIRVGVAWEELREAVRGGMQNALRTEREVGFIYLLYVLPRYWGCGVGKALLHGGLEQLRELGMREAVLWVLRDNQRARAFYTQCGWLQDGRTVPADYGGVELEALCYRLASL